jgi:hypothetical protein
MRVAENYTVLFLYGWRGRGDYRPKKWQRCYRWSRTGQSLEVDHKAMGKEGIGPVTDQPLMYDSLTEDRASLHKDSKR